MTAINIQLFGGERPRIDRKLLRNEEAYRAHNTRLTGGALDPLFAPKVLDSVTTIPASGTKSLYRLYDDNGEYWLGWTSNVDVARSAVEGDKSFRFGFTSDEFEPRVSNLQLAVNGLKYPDAWYVLGVHPPVNAPSVSATGGTGTTEDRAYVYTYVTEWGEESKPSPASSIVTGKTDSTWTVSGMDTAPPNTFTVTSASWASGVATFTLDSTFALRVHETISISGCSPSGYDVVNARITSISGNDVTVSIDTDPGAYVSGGSVSRDAPHHISGMVKRIYRSVTSATDAGYYYVGEVPVSTTSFTDTPSTTIGEELTTTTWNMPPANMEGIHTLASGVAVGFAGNTVYISEPLAMYAYPTEYAFVTNYNIIGIGTIGTAVVVVTDGFPFIINGVSPESMSMERMDNYWACQNKNSIVESEYGVVWPTKEGLVQYNIDGASVVTANFFTINEWKDVPYADFKSAYRDHKYYGAYVDSEGKGHVFIFDLNGGGIVSYADVYAATLHTDAVTNNLYIIDSNGTLAEWDSYYNSTLSQEWWSKTFTAPKPINFAIGRVDADYIRNEAEQAAYEAAVAAQEALNAAIISSLSTDGGCNDASLNTYSMNGSAIKPVSLIAGGEQQSISINIYADDELFYSTSVTSDEPFRLPAGTLYRDVSIQILSSVRVHSVHIATSVTELNS